MIGRLEKTVLDRPDVRVCFLGDSFVAGVGDPGALGWVGRLVALGHARGLPVTAYNLGVRRDTSADVLARWRPECAARLPAGSDARVVVAFGVNDAVEEGGRPRVEPATSVANLAWLLRGAAAAGWAALVVGPPPIADEPVNRRTAALDEAFGRVCAEQGVRYVPVSAPLRDDPRWTSEIRAGDGAHPAAGGYEALAALVAPAWTGWLAG